MSVCYDLSSIQMFNDIVNNSNRVQSPVPVLAAPNLASNNTSNTNITTSSSSSHLNKVRESPEQFIVLSNDFFGTNTLFT
jgi:hypothetical protein